MTACMQNVVYRNSLNQQLVHFSPPSADFAGCFNYNLNFGERHQDHNYEMEAPMDYDDQIWANLTSVDFDDMVLALEQVAEDQQQATA